MFKKMQGMDAVRWDKDSRWIAAIMTEMHNSISPIGILSGLSGHPLQYYTVSLQLIDAQSGNLKTYLLRKNVFNPATSILSLE